MQRSQRLTGRKNFSTIRKNGRGVTNQLLVLRTIPNGLDTSRFAFVAGKRIGNAVARNRLKRRLREAMLFASVKSGSDIVFIARKGSAEASFQHLKEAALTLLQRSRLLEGETPGERQPKSQPSPEQRPEDTNHPAAPQPIGTA